MPRFRFKLKNPFRRRHKEEVSESSDDSGSGDDDREYDDFDEDMSLWESRMISLLDGENFASEETTALLWDIYELCHQHPSERKTEVISVLLEWQLVELVQKIWRRHLEPKLLENNEELPDYIAASVSTLWTLSNTSDKVCERIIETELNVDMVEVLSWDALSPDQLRSRDSGYHRRRLVSAYIGTLHNVVQRASTARSSLRRCQAVDVLQNLRKVIQFPVIAHRALMVQSYLVNEDENKRLNSNSDAFQWLVNALGCAFGGRTCDGIIFDVVEVLKAINNLAVTDGNKLKIVEAGALPFYVKLLSPERDETEHFQAAHGLWMLAFKCRESIIAEKCCIEELRMLEKSSSSEKVRSEAAGALWILEKKDGQQFRGRVGAHVMISYNWSCQSTVLQIRDHLRKAGFKIWIDVDHMSGSLLESMARAVEQAAVVLLCFSEKYKESPNCRTEAEYAYNKRKPIVPLRLEPGYTPDGWLGPLCINNLYYDLSVPDKFDNEIRKLHSKLKQLEVCPTACDSVDGGVEEVCVKASAAAVAMATPPRAVASRDPELSIDNWTTSDVQNWLKHNRLKHLSNWFKDYDGPLLAEMVKMHRKSPDELEKSLRTEKFSVTDCLKLKRALELLHTGAV